MASLKALQKKIPTATASLGRVVARIDGKNVVLGKYAGDDAVVLFEEAGKYLNPAPKPQDKKPEIKGLDLPELEV